MRPRAVAGIDVNMSSNRAAQPAQNSSAVAERLLAHARLCEQIAQDCLNEETAAELRRMARKCTHVAARVAPERDAQPQSSH